MIVDGIFHDGRACFWLAYLLRNVERDARADGETLPSGVIALIDEIRQRARLERQRATEKIDATNAEGGTPGTANGFRPGNIQGMTTSQVAEALQTSTSNIRKRARNKSLPARETSAGWVFDPVEIAALVAERKHT